MAPTVSRQAPESSFLDTVDRRPFPEKWSRDDGNMEYHCHACGRLLIVTNVVLDGKAFIQVMCKRCGRERRFTASSE